MGSCCYRRNIYNIKKRGGVIQKADVLVYVGLSESQTVVEIYFKISQLVKPKEGREKCANGYYGSWLSS